MKLIVPLYWNSANGVRIIGILQTRASYSLEMAVATTTIVAEMTRRSEN
jgi:hypothetical protein